MEMKGKNMKTIELLKFLQSKIGGELDFKAAVGHENHILSVPRLLVDPPGFMTEALTSFPASSPSRLTYIL